MKKIILTLAIFLACNSYLFAQSECIIPLMVYVPEQAEELPLTAQSTLESKLRQMVTQNGMEGGSRFSNFCLVANTTEGSKEILSGLRPTVALTIDLELYVGNNYTGEKFASTFVTLNGAGRNEAKAYSSAFGSVTSNNVKIQQFLKDAKRKVANYYETQISNILSQAKNYALKNEYEEALCLLSSVPTCCNRYGEVERCMKDVFQSFVNYDCAVKVNKARAIWNATQNKEGAALAGAYIAAIDPSSSCWNEALALSEKIRERIGDDWEFAKELQRDAVDLEKARIEAMRAIGIAFGENQKAVTVRENWMVR